MDVGLLACRKDRRSPRDLGSEWEDLKSRTINFINEHREELPANLAKHPYSFGARYENLLAPAGNYYQVPLSNEPGGGRQSARSLWMLFRQREIGRLGLPDIFEAWIASYDSQKKVWADILEPVPAQSADEALSRFRTALTTDEANTLADLLGDSTEARLFGLVASPACLAEALRTPAPTAQEVNEARDELAAAASTLAAALDKWEGTDAYRFLLAVKPRSLSRLRLREPLVLLVDHLRGIDQRPVRKRPGRRVQGGRQHMVVRTLGALWTSCGLGEVKFSPHSRFIRACTVVLPWHGVHKADVSQFVRGELAKRMVGEVLTD